MHEFDLNAFNKLKQKTEDEYKKIGSVLCPALKALIYFNSDGFHHLRYDGHRSERSKIVQKYKFIFLNQAVEIIQKTTTVQEFRQSICPIGKLDKSGFRKTGPIKWYGFYAITNYDNPTRIMVVVRKIGENGQYHFWSVMPYWSLSNKKRVVGSEKIIDN